jgi:hypothetical protein
MTSRIVGVGIAVVLLAMETGSLQAQEQTPFRVEFDRLVLLAGGADADAERVVVPGDEILRTRIGYAATARLAAPMSAVVAGTTLQLPADADLIEARPRGATRRTVGPNARVFCASPHSAATKGSSNVEQPEARSTVSGSPCLVDADGDHQFESAFLLGAQIPSGRSLPPLPSRAPYSESTNVPLPDSYAWITFERGAALQGPVLELHVNLFGRAPAIRGIRVRIDGDERFFPIERTVRRSTYPHTITFAGAQVEILGYTSEGRHLQVRVAHPFETAPLKLDMMGPNIIFISR